MAQNINDGNIQDVSLKSESQYRSLFNAMTESFALCEIVLDRNGKPADYRFIDTNPSFEKFIGLNRVDIVGKLRSQLPVALSPSSFAAYVRVAQTGRPEYFENYNDTLKKIYNVYVYRPAPGQFATIFTDITEQQKINETLRQTKDYLESLFDYANAPIIVWNTGFKITRFNAAFERLTGYLSGEVIGQELALLFPEDSREESLDKINRTLAGEQWEVVEIPIRRKDGNIRIALWNSANIYDKTGRTLIATIAQGQDITERKNSEKEIEHLASFPRVNPNPIIELDMEGKVVFCNKSARDAGADTQLFIPNNLTELIPNLKNNALPTAYSEVVIDDRIFGETIHYLKDLDAIRIYAFDITQRKLAETKLNKLNRTLKALNNSNQALLTANDEISYLQKICDIIINVCGYPMTWVGYANHDEEKNVVPVAHAGFEKGYLKSLKISWADNDRGRGPTGTAIRTGKACGCSNMQTDPAFAPWRQAAIERNYASSVSLPLSHGGDILGAITIYSRQPDDFSRDEIDLLQELADDVANGIFSINLEIAKKQAEDALRESEKKFHQIADAIPNLVWTTSPDGNVEYVNLTFRNYTGADDDLEGPVWNAVPIANEQKREMELAHKKATDIGQPYQFEQRIKRANGSWRWHLTHCMPIKNSEGTIIKWYCTATDIHEIKKAQEDLRDADGEKNKFISTMSHELRNPLTPIVTGIELVKSYLDMDVPGETRDSSNDAIIRESVSIIDQQAKTMARLLDDMLDISRISRGKVQLIKKAVSLRKSLASAAEAVATLMKSQNHTFSMTLPDASLRVWADPVRLQQIFVNLLNNAIKYTPPGGRIWLRAEPVDDYAQITVRDTGLGIEPENIKSIFLSYGNSRNTTPFVSTQGELGIGLKLTKDLVSMHGGTITASSAGKNMGCEFTVRLRLLPAGEKTESDPAQNGEIQSAPGSGLRALVVDDNTGAADLCAKTLRFFGHETQVCYNAPEALDAVKSYRPHIMFVDIEMPGMNGYQLAEKLRKTEGWQTAPIKLVALTGYGQKEDKERALASGFDLHLAKPVTMQTLQQTIRNLTQTP